MFTVILNRSDFKDATRDVNYFEAYLLEALKVPKDKLETIESIELWIKMYEYWPI